MAKIGFDFDFNRWLEKLTKSNNRVTSKAPKGIKLPCGCLGSSAIRGQNGVIKCSKCKNVIWSNPGNKQKQLKILPSKSIHFKRNNFAGPVF